MKINSKWVRDMDIKSLSIEQLERVVIEDFSTTNPNTSIFKICVNYRDDVPGWFLMEYICKVKMFNGTERELLMDQIHNEQILERLRNGVEYYEIVPVENYCVIVLQDEKFQWGYTLVWDCIEDKIVYLTNTPYTITSTVINNNVVNLYLVQYWGHPADWWYSISPLNKIDPEYEPDIVPLKISADKYRGDDTCFISERNGKIYFHVGKQVDRVSID